MICPNCDQKHTNPASAFCCHPCWLDYHAPDVCASCEQRETTGGRELCLACEEREEMSDADI